jgi:26S proteasome non-ATPase regulatory subunit 10
MPSHLKIIKRSLLTLLSVALIGITGCFLKPLPHSDYRPIHQAAGGCDVVRVAQILSTNPAVLNITEDGGRAALHVASARCCTNVIALLLEKGAKLELKGKTGETPLHVAAQEGCSEAVGMLVNKGAKINARDNDGDTPLKRALDYRQDATVALLRKLGAVE